MARNEKTSARVAALAGKVLSSEGLRTAMLTTAKGKTWYLPWNELRKLAASCLTQTADNDFIPKSPPVRKAMRGQLGARIKSKKPSSWPPSAKPPRRSP